MQIDETMIRNVVSQVLAEVSVPGSVNTPRPTNGSPKHGVFHDANEAVVAAHAAFEQLQERSMEDRKRIIDHIRRISIDQSVELGTMEMDETKIGRLEHKIDKLKTLGQRSPGVEFLKSEVFTGDQGIAIIEHAPFGVIGAITPVTHSLPTITGNAVSMIAGGNTLVVNPHPSGKKVAAEGVRRFNKAIYQDLGIDNLICVIAEPTLETADTIFSHRDVAIICVTGGPAVARAALNSGKRAVVAGPGNPPVVVDETADLKNAAESIITGGAYDNNLLCIAEKEVFVVSSVFDELMRQMEIAGAHRLNSQQINDLTSQAIIQVGDDNHDAPAKEYLGQDASVLAAAAGVSIAASTTLLFGETEHSHPFVSIEQMMPFVPFVRVRDVEEGIQLAKKYEHGFRHTAIMHSTNVKNMTRMGRVLDTTLFVKNGPSMGGLGLGGEGYPSFSIAGPTGEGVTTPLTFTRERRTTLIGDLSMLGK